MAKRGRPKAKFQLTIGEDPSLWRFANVQEAIQANRDVLTQMIRRSEAKAHNTQHEPDDECESTVSESA